jgi:dephospho-CoA kinase
MPAVGTVFGLTGGIASGKTFVSDQFATLGAAIIDTDVIAREVVAIGSEGLAAIVQRFGADVLNPDGSLARDRMRKRVFADDAARAELEAITHPRIRSQVRSQLQQVRDADTAPYAIVVIPLLTEKGNYDFLDAVIVVDCGVDTQRQRLLKRDGISPELVEQMLQAQASRAKRMAQAQHVIGNDDGASVINIIHRLHQRFCGA